MARTVLITGCSSGIGRISARLMVAIHALLPDRVWRALLGAGINRAPKPPHGATLTGTA
jgi:NAD(P)-dependent dehydrogenase (short-subunit alcohol dehydrogenase family)